MVVARKTDGQRIATSRVFLSVKRWVNGIAKQRRDDGHRGVMNGHVSKQIGRHTERERERERERDRQTDRQRDGQTD